MLRLMVYLLYRIVQDFPYTQYNQLKKDLYSEFEREKDKEEKGERWVCVRVFERRKKREMEYKISKNGSG